MAVYGFSKRKNAEILNRFAEATEPTTDGKLKYPELKPSKGIFIAKTPSGGIPAATEDGSGNLTPGTADCNIYSYNPDTGKYEPKKFEDNSNFSLEVDNISQTAVAGSTFIQFKREHSGRYVCDFEDCS